MTQIIRSTPSTRRPLRIAGLFLSTALVAGLLSGCGSAVERPGKFARNAEQALQGGQADKAVALAERAVAIDGRNSGYRLLLANAYLRAGRFESARAAYDDAMELGEDGGKAALSLALAQIALGRGNEAVDTLNTYSDAIPAVDLGLALALAGQTGRGARMLADVLRQGQNTPKVRQNLALAYALDGSWREAQIMAAQDVPADKLDARLKSWAALAGPEQARLRVATLLGTPVRNDQGQPAELALANFPAKGQAAASAGAEPAPNPATAEPAQDQPAKGQAQAVARAAVGELPPLDAPATARPALADASSQPARAQLAVIDLPPSRTAPAARPMSGVAMIAGQPTVASTLAPRGAPVRASAKPLSVALTTVAAQASAQSPAQAQAQALATPSANVAPPEHSTHVAQLGAFGTPGGARRAWRHFVARDPNLAGYRSVITRAVVHGREFWRVQAAGFASVSPARDLCGSIRARGGACMVLAVAPTAPAAVPGQAIPAPARLARNR